MRGQCHETAIAPEMTGGEIFLLQAGTTLALDLARNRTPPIRPAALSLEQPIIKARITLDIVAHAPRRVEVDGLERPHEAPAQRQPLAQRDIHVLAGSIAVGHQAERLLQQRALKPVDNEALDLALHDNRRLA